MEDSILRVKKLREGAIIPTRHFDDDAGLDLYSAETVVLFPGERNKIPTGIALEVPAHTVGLIWDKSGLSNTHGLKTLGGVVDAGFRGEIMVGLANLSNEPYTIERGHKVAQLLIQKIEHVRVEVVSELSLSSRGEGAFGSTGK